MCGLRKHNNLHNNRELPTQPNSILVQYAYWKECNEGEDLNKMANSIQNILLN